jgi:hypothetical protein
MSIDLSQLTEKQLLSLSSEIIRELRKREIVRTNNPPVGDYAEWLVAKHLNLKLYTNSKASIDAISNDGIRYQIKARSATNITKAVRLSAIRKLDEQGFDFLIAVFFNTDFDLELCLSIPWNLVREIATYQPHTNSHILTIKPIELIKNPNIQNLTTLFQESKL